MTDKQDASSIEAPVTNGYPIKPPLTTTYRLSRIPASFTLANVKELFNNADQANIRDPVSLANSVYMTDLHQKVATVTFLKPPKFADGLVSSAPDLTSPLVAPVGAEDYGIQVDSHFEGLTPLNDPEPRSITSDIVACTGLAAGAFIGWQHASGHMWLRDSLPVDLPGSRIFIWGKRSQLHRSQSHMSVSHYRDSLLDDLDKIRQTPAERRRPLILVGHSLGGIVTKAAFVKASQNDTYSVLRHTLGGLVFIGTPHEGIQNNDWVNVWSGEPSGVLIRDLAPGSSLLRELREGFEHHLLQEKILTIFEHQETPTIRKKEDGKLDRHGDSVLRIDEKAACVFTANEVRVGINENHSKIARLQSVEGSPYHTIKHHMQDIISHARSIVSVRILRRSILGVLVRLRAYFQHLLRTSTEPSVLLLAECSDLDALCNIIDQPDDRLSDLGPSTASMLTVLRAAEKLEKLFCEAINEASCHSVTLSKQLRKLADDVWPTSRGTNGHIPAPTAMHTEDLINAAVPLILDLKESLSAAFSSQDPSVLRAFIESDQAKHLGLHLIVQRRELLSKPSIPVAQPSVGIVLNMHEKNGLTIGTFHSQDGLTARSVIVETRNYKVPDADQQKQRKEASKELAAILRDSSFNSWERDPVRRQLSLSMSVFEFEGYIDDMEAGLLTFMYRIPTQVGVSSHTMIHRSRSLAYWIRDTGDGPPSLEERYAVAYHLCHTVFNQHVSGWVHKSIRPGNVILFPTRNKESELMGPGRAYTHIPYLKGFELSRRMTGIVSDFIESDTSYDVYRHPNRRGENILAQFRPVHDLYALGVLLIEIGTGKPIVTSIKELNTPPASGIFEDDSMRIAREKLPKNLGTRYTECALRCLAGYEGFQVSSSDKDDANLTFAFRTLIVDDLKRMAVACGCSL